MIEDPVSDDSLLQENDALQKRLEQLKQQRRLIQNQQRRQAQLAQSLQQNLNQSLLSREQALQDLRSCLKQTRRTTSLLQLSQQWNVLADCFHISHRGAFGTINGLRLGAEAPSLDLEPTSSSSDLGTSTSTCGQQQQPSAPNRLLFGASFDPPPPPSSPPPPTMIRVPWVEINAALGHVVLLLSTLQSRLHADIALRHTLIPAGSTSKIGIRRRPDDETSAVAVYNLYYSDEVSISLFFGRRNLNIALNGLLECVQDAVQAIQSRDRTIAVPHKIERQQQQQQRDGSAVTIGGLSVAYGTDGVGWTRAMKYMLTDLKHLLTFRALSLWDA